ncbi:MAG: hypothetical protein ABR875_02030 [Minisyncoccia bacterium]
MKKPFQKGFTPLESASSIKKFFNGRFCNFKKDSLTGFTLIEAIVSTLIFSIILTIIGGAFSLFLNSQRRAMNIQQAIENSNFIFESMAKEIRMSTILDVGNDNCPGTYSTTLNIEHPINGLVTYQWDNGNLYRTVKNQTTNATTTTMLNSDSVQLTGFKFCKMGVEVGDQIQQRVTIISSVSTKNSSDQQAVVDVQTTISTRNLETNP